MDKFDFTKLDTDQKSEYVKVAEQMFGKTIVFCETGEPMYFNPDNTLNPIHQFVLDRIKINKSTN